jgi:hypothetical protein
MYTIIKAEYVRKVLVKEPSCEIVGAKEREISLLASPVGIK